MPTFPSPSSSPPFSLTNLSYSYVSEIDESQVVSSSAYVLFYRRRDTFNISAVPANYSLPPTDEEEEEEDDDPESNGTRTSSTPPSSTATAPSSTSPSSIDDGEGGRQGTAIIRASGSHMDLD